MTTPDPRVQELRASPWTRRWLYACKPASWPKLLVPMFLGQSVGGAFEGTLSVPGVLVGGAYTMGTLVFLVLLNDWADLRIDCLKRARFGTECSPKALADGIVSPRVALAVGLSAGLLGLAVLWWAAAEQGRVQPFVAGALGLALLVAYSLPPLRLNYRGGGELLEAFGVGVLLPWINAQCQSAASFRFWIPYLVGTTSLALASAIASGLSDEETDREGGKRTIATMVGNQRARFLTEVATLNGYALWMMFALKPQTANRWGLLLAALCGVVLWSRVIGASQSAVKNAFPALNRYKRRLHLAVWLPTLLLGVSAWLG